MKLRFYIDAETNLPHIYSHNVEEYEVEEAFYKQIENRPETNESRSIIGKTEAGRLLRMICAEKNEYTLVVTAYQLRGKQLKSFNKRQRRK